jgi:hypothetical protein
VTLYDINVYASAWGGRKGEERRRARGCKGVAKEKVKSQCVGTRRTY